MTPQEAADLAVRTFAAIDDVLAAPVDYGADALHRENRERVASDLAGIERHQHCGQARNGLWVSTCIASDPCDDHAAFAAGLLRTAVLYGEKP